MRLRLLVPDLWPPAGMEDAGSGLRLPGLEWMLGKGTVADSGGESVEAWLFRSFGVERRGDWPVAALTLLADGGDPGTDAWLRADPVSLRPDRAHVVLADSAPRLSPDEAATLTQALNRHFRDEDLEFLPLNPRRWYLRLPAVPAMVSHAPREAAGGDVDEFLPAGPDALKWHRLMNEAQMLLHEHPLNEAREGRGESPVNSVWLWGAGALPGGAACNAAAVWSGEPLAAGLARLAGIPCRPLPSSAAGWLREADPYEDALAVLDELSATARGGAPGEWRETLQALEKSWFAPLADALRARRLAGLAISCPAPERSRELVVDAANLWKFWRGPRRLA